MPNASTVRTARNLADATRRLRWRARAQRHTREQRRPPVEKPVTPPVVMQSAAGDEIVTPAGGVVWRPLRSIGRARIHDALRNTARGMAPRRSLAIPHTHSQCMRVAMRPPFRPADASANGQQDERRKHQVIVAAQGLRTNATPVSDRHRPRALDDQPIDGIEQVTGRNSTCSA